jgi:hypothetical protein
LSQPKLDGVGNGGVFGRALLSRIQRKCFELPTPFRWSIAQPLDVDASRLAALHGSAHQLGEYILRSWSLVKMGTSANQKKVFFNLRKAQSKISILDYGDMRQDQVKIIARRLGVPETDVIYMNRRLGGDASLNAAIHEDGDSGEWQDWLLDESPEEETTLAASEEFDNRRKIRD